MRLDGQASAITHLPGVIAIKQKASLCQNGRNARGQEIDRQTTATMQMRFAALYQPGIRSKGNMFSPAPVWLSSRDHNSRAAFCSGNRAV